MIDRRNFLHGAGLAAVNLAFLPAIVRAAERIALNTPEEAARDEDYWATVRRAFRLDGRFVDLQGNAVASAPIAVLDEAKRTSDVVHSLPAYHLFRYALSEKTRARTRLASLLGANADEIGLVRNTTEAITTVLRGIKVEPGSEVVTTNQDYPPFIRAWQARAERENFTVRVLELPEQATNDQLVELFDNALQSQVSTLMACHVLWRNGRVLPIERICALARQRNVTTIIDGAHGFCQVPTDVREFGCDYYGNSLHKWALGPIGTGLLYMRKERIAETLPLFMPWDSELAEDRIEKFEGPGTSLPAWPSVNASLDLLEAIGLERKFARHAYLTRYWTEQLKDTPGVVLSDEPDQQQAGGFAVLNIEGIETYDLFRHLLDIHSLLPGYNESGLVVASQIYTRKTDLDAFVSVIKNVAQNGIPSTVV